MLPGILLVLIPLSLAAVPAPAESIRAIQGASCVTMLGNLSRSADTQGYTVSATTSTLTGIDKDRNRLDARCDSEHTSLELTAPDGSRVNVELALDSATGGGLEVAGDFPGTGTIVQTVVLRGFLSGAPTGVLTITAEVGSERSIAEAALTDDAWTNSGDGAAVSSALAPVLDASKLWTDGQLFALALSGMWDRLQSETGAADRVLGVMQLPGDPRMSKADKNTLKSCLAAGAACGLGVLLKFAFGSGGACWVSGGACFAAAACSLHSECSKD